MYGREYFGIVPAEGYESPKEFGRVLAWIQRVPGSVFVDYGCGDGELLVKVAEFGWRAVGVELDEDVAKEVEKRTGSMVVGCRGGTNRAPLADVLHLGDVIEHLTDINVQIPRILQMIRPGGVLLAQGPLEANASLFSTIVRMARWLRPWRQTSMPPYHVIVATTVGQRRLFQRFGLKELTFQVEEVSWPAPSRLSLAVLRSPRLLAMYLIRRFSQRVSRARLEVMGNRYFYAGAVGEAELPQFPAKMR